MSRPNRHRLTEEELDKLLIKELLSRYNQLRSTRYIFAINYRELRTLIMESEQLWFSIPVRDPFTRHSSEKLRRILEISRLLHNFLAVAMSLKDHTNRVVDRVFTEDYFQIYENQVKSIFSDKHIPRFTQDLRNYSLHRQLPLAGSQTTLRNNGPITTFITLNKKKLLDWDGWSIIDPKN